MYYEDGHSTGGTETFGPAFDIPIGTHSELDTEVSKTGGFNNCTHSKWVYHGIPHPGALPPLAMLDQNPFNEVLEVQYKGLGFPLVRDVSGFLKEYSTLSLFDVDDIDWISLANHAVTTMKPSFKAGNSLINFLIEMKDFKGVAKAIWNRIGSPHKGFGEILDQIRGFKSADSPMSKLAKGHLSYAFAWRPFYEDCVSLFNTLSKFRTRYKEIVRRANIPQQSYYGTNIQEPNPTSVLANSGTVRPGSWFAGLNAEWYWAVNETRDRPIRYSATMRFKYPLPDVLGTSWGEFFALMDSLGVNSNPAIIWNAIPFSFLIDWFIGIGRLLDGLRVDNVVFQTEIMDFCHSAKSIITLDASAQARNYNTHYPLGQGVSLGKVIASRYVRRVGIPPALFTMTTSGLNIREFLLGGSLLKSRRRRARKPFTFVKG